MHEQTKDTHAAPPPTSYREVKMGKTLYRVTSVYLGEIELGAALEELAVNKALQSARQVPAS